MKPIKPEDIKSNVEELEGILDNAWVKSELAKYNDFREKHSHIDIWSHRYPTTSPIVPLLFQYHNYYNPKYQRKQNLVLGYWYGDPLYYLAFISNAICIFKSYWSSLPSCRGADNIQFKLTEAGQFNGFQFELLVAESSLLEYKDYSIEPLFFNPDSIPGGADIVLNKGIEKRAIQCKAKNPMSDSNMSFDIFQYLFGCFYRLVQDYGHIYKCYKLSMNLKQKFEIKDTQGLLDLITPAVRTGLDIPNSKIDPCYDIELTSLSIPRGGLNETQINRIKQEDKANLYTEVGYLNKKLALFSVSSPAGLYKPLGDYIVKTVKEAAQEARVGCPLSIAIHLYQDLNWEEYLNSASKQRSLLILKKKLDGIFKSYQWIEYVTLSSNIHEYMSSPDEEVFFKTQGLEISNPYYINQIKEYCKVKQ